MAVRGRSKRGGVAAAMSVIALTGLGLVIPISISLSPGDLPSGAVVAASGDQVALTTPIPMDIIGTQILADRGVLSLSNAKNSGDSRAAERQLLGTGRGSLVADGVTFAIGVPAPGATTAPRDATDEPPLLTALATGQFETLNIRRSTLFVTYAANRTERLGNVALEVTRRRKALFAFKGTAEIRGLTHAIEGSFGSGDKRALVQPPLKLTINGPLIKATFDGTGPGSPTGAVAGMLDFAFAIDAPVALSLRTLTQAAPPSYAATADDFRIKGDMRWAQDALAFDKATVHLRGQEAQGALHIGFQPTRTTFSGTLAADSLDIGQLLRGNQQKSVALETIEGVAARIAFWLPSRSGASWLSDIDADLRFSASRIVGLPQEVGAAAVSLYMRAGKLNATVSEFNYGRGRATGEVTVDFDRAVPVATLRAKADGMDLAGLTAPIAGFPVLTGPAQILVDLKSEGLGADQIARSLHGQISLLQKDWGRLGIDVRSLLVSTQRTSAVGWPALRGFTTYDQLDAKMTVRAGSVSIDSLTMKQGDGIITANGGFGLSNGRLFVDVMSPPAAPFGRLLPVQGLADPTVETIEFRGTFATPEARRRAPPRSADPVTPPPAPNGRSPG
jgi:AsmA-like C-terminal region